MQEIECYQEHLMPYVYLAIAIVSEVIGTTALKATEGFTRPLPSAIVVVGYAIAFYFLSLCLQSIQIGTAYAIWCGGGIVLISITAAITYRQFPDAWGVVGIGLILAGVLVLNLLSKSAVH
jgi:small multidrug resistance pump